MVLRTMQLVLCVKTVIGLTHVWVFITNNQKRLTCLQIVFRFLMQILCDKLIFIWQEYRNAICHKSIALSKYLKITHLLGDKK